MPEEKVRVKIGVIAGRYGESFLSLCILPVKVLSTAASPVACFLRKYFFNIQ